MADSETVDIHIGPYDYTNDIRANLGYHVMFPLLHNTLQNPVCISILLSHHHAYVYRCSRHRFCSFFLIDVFRHPCDVVTYVWPDDDRCRHTERALRISLHRWRSKSHSRAI
jgi:hypothetical protein